MAGVPRITPVDTKGVPRAALPQFIQIEPPAAVAAGATVNVRYTVGPRNFVSTGMGYTSQPVGIPAAGQRFRINIQDVGGSVFFAPVRFLARPVFGCDEGTSDKSYIDLPAPWRFEANTTINVEFENIGLIACIPTLVLIGYLE
jgi:hypothetical protein